MSLHNILKLRSSLLKIYNGWHMSTKLFIVFSLITMVLFIGLQWRNFNGSKKILDNQMSNDAKIILLRSNQYLNSYYENIKTILLLIASQKNLFNNSNLNSDLRDYVDYSSQFVKTLYVVTGDDKVYCSNSMVYNILGNNAINEIAEKAKSDSGGIKLQGPYYASISSDTFAFYLPIRQNNTYQGTVIVEARIDSMYQSLSSLLGYNQSFIITTSDGTFICSDKNNTIIPFEKEVFPSTINYDFLQLLKKQSAGVERIRFDKSDLMIYKSTENLLAWNTFILFNRKIYNSDLSNIYSGFFISILLGVVFILISTFIISYFFTDPIRKLALKMDKLTLLDNTSFKDINKNDEVGILVGSLNSMLNRINDLDIQRQDAERKKKEYEFKMLQSQIGPHFLYNTLACIGSLATQHKDDEIKSTVRSLISLLSFSFDKRSEFITIADELYGLQMYCNIQRMRYGDIFQVKTYVADDVENSLIPKLTLQPLLENSIFHGILPKKQNGLIYIRVISSNNILHITVKDNGVGYIKENMTKKSFSVDISEHYKLNSVGINNINERIRLYYGNEYGLRIRGKKNVGTIVKLTLPDIK